MTTLVERLREPTPDTIWSSSRGSIAVQDLLREAAAYIEELEKDRDSWRGAAYSWKKIADPINDKNIDALFDAPNTALAGRPAEGDAE